MKKFIIFILSVMVFTSCYTTKTYVGNYKQLSKTMQSYEYDQARQFYVISGLVPLGRPQPKMPNEPCMIQVKSKFVDYLLSLGTFGILSSRTVEVFALQGGSAYPTNNNVYPESDRTPVANGSTMNVVKIDGNDTSVANENATTASDNTIPSQNASTQENTAQNVATQEKVYTPVRQPDHNAEAVEPVQSSDARVSFENPTFRVGEKVFYKMRDRVYSATIISFKGSDIAVVEMENGAIAERYLKDLVKAKK